MVWYSCSWCATSWPLGPGSAPLHDQAPLLIGASSRQGGDMPGLTSGPAPLLHTAAAARALCSLQGAEASSGPTRAEAWLGWGLGQGLAREDRVVSDGRQGSRLSREGCAAQCSGCCTAVSAAGAVAAGGAECHCRLAGSVALVGVQRRVQWPEAPGRQRAGLWHWGRLVLTWQALGPEVSSKQGVSTGRDCGTSGGSGPGVLATVPALTHSCWAASLGKATLTCSSRCSAAMSWS
ncbi:hypothetical protein V8C86DRAFT_2450285 [Haematococcus lacustris]